MLCLTLSGHGPFVLTLGDSVLSLEAVLPSLVSADTAHGGLEACEFTPQLPCSYPLCLATVGHAAGLVPFEEISVSCCFARMLM